MRDKPVCGKCSQSLLPSFPIDLVEDKFAKFIARTEVPVVVDFWAPDTTGDFTTQPLTPCDVTT